MRVSIKSQVLSHLEGKFQISQRMHTATTTVEVTMTEKICHLIWGTAVIVAVISKHIQDFRLLSQQVINSAMENL